MNRLFFSRGLIGAVPDATNNTPLECDCHKFVDWRWRTALNLAAAAVAVPRHDDQSIQEAAQVLAAAKGGCGGRQLTDQERVVLTAFRFSQEDTLLRAVVEASLLVQQTPAEIATKWSLCLPLIDTFAKLLFDVRGTDGRHAWVYASQFGHLAGEMFRPGLGQGIRTLAICGGMEMLEEVLAVVFRLEGPTLAADMPSRESPNWEREFEIRVRLGLAMLPLRHTFGLRTEANAAIAEHFATDQYSPHSLEVLQRILTIVKVPKAMRNEIAQLRLSRTMVGDRDQLPPPAKKARRTPRRHQANHSTACHLKKGSTMTNIDNTLQDDLWASLADDDSLSGPPVLVKHEEAVRPPPQRADTPKSDPEMAARIAEEADNLKNAAAASYLTGSLQPLFGLGILPGAFLRYRNQLIEDCGSPTDPITIMMIEQVALAHHNIGKMHVRSALAKTVLEASVYSAAAAKLLTEFRRWPLALAELRSGHQAKSIPPPRPAPRPRTMARTACIE